ncbi:ABC transporter substrate-binding protein [Rhizobium sp. LC145]|jgi:putative spermidine/putrescine transport system substrate-binding protein|uniref:ABC transporter substrate-binding protein n=1 Tax=Rhizobium sp. LC145 TaxID=1120688 RepID=UPI00062A43B9|nr:ABC transporter substrate-binding protein [Rhizobium sp. LC145]KKX33272.1 ABC transporter substrate-binding protein [Rhizobium sp. LC145]TKT55854.1 ABC transporter substrate-binding protein [Rhizobiaceae bacterium LC148]
MPARKTFLMPDRRTFLKTAGAAVSASLAAPYIARGQENVLYVNTWGGPWEEAAKAHLIDPFTAETGIQVKTVSPVSFAKLAQQVNTGIYEFDVTTLGAGELVRANDAGIIEELEAPYEGGLFENGIASHAFATVLAWRSDKYKEAPKTWADFWNMQKFPGGRSLQRYAARVLPIALLADGVAVKDLYPLDVDRAFASLDKIKPHIRVWWTAGAQSTQILRDGEVDMIGIWHGRFFEAEKARAPVAMTWDQGEIDRSYWVVAKDTPNLENAKKFVQFATSAKPLAGFCKAADYGPLNPASGEFVTAEEAKRMPTSPENYSRTFEQDMANFGADPAEIAERFEEWIAS